MSRIDITKNILYIENPENVICSDIKYSSKPLSVDGRHSDAFVYILDGSCKYIFDDGRTLIATKGDILYLANKSVYKMWILSEIYKFIFCDFMFSDSNERLSDVFSIENSDTESYFRKLLKAFKETGTYGFAESLSLLYKIHGIICKSANAEYVGKDTKQKIEKVKQSIEQGYQNENLSIGELAKSAGMSEVYMRKLFGKVYGTSPSQYITNVRINEAKKLLDYPFLSIEECAKQCGFSTLQYFSRVFKNTCGMTPSEYRKNKKDR